MGKKKNQEKDPNKPKRAMTAFMCFSKEQRPNVVAKNPDLKFGEVGKTIGRLWNDLSEDDKQPYVEVAKADKERYEKEMSTYVPRTKDGKAPKPKRAMTAYLFFCKAHRDEVKEAYPELKMIEIQKKLGERWKRATDQEKVPFVKQAQADRKRYDEEVLKNQETFCPPQDVIAW